MKVLSKILGAILLLGCLAYISFVFGKYVLSSTLLKSIPKSERIINTVNPIPTRNYSPDSIQDNQEYTPQVQMRVVPDQRSTSDSSVDAGSSSNDSVDSDNSIRIPKKFDEGKMSPRRRRRSRHNNTSIESDEVKKATSEIDSTVKTPKKKPAISSPPIRRLNQEEKKVEISPVPKPEKSTSTSTSGSGDAASISPVPKAE